MVAMKLNNGSSLVLRFVFFILLLLAHSKISSAATSKQIKLGQEFRLKCPTNVLLHTKWYKDNKLIKAIGKRIVFRRKGKTLKIKDAKNEDIGLYKCYGVDSKGHRKKIKAFDVSSITGGKKRFKKKLQFADPAKMIHKRYSFSPTGNNIAFNCLARGSKPMKYSWYKNLQKISDKSTLRLNRLKFSNSGDYTCRVENDDGKIEFTFSLNVLENFRSKPYLDSTTVKNQTRYKGEETSISCFEHYTGLLNNFNWVKWKNMKNDTVLEKLNFDKNSTLVNDMVKRMPINKYKPACLEDNIFKRGKKKCGVQLKLDNLRIEDSGWYTCIVTNDRGFDFLSMYLNVIEKEVDGGFTDWSEYGACSEECGGGIQESRRSCTNPTPKHGGKNCVGASTRTKQCNTQPCLTKENVGIRDQHNAEEYWKSKQEELLGDN